MRSISVQGKILVAVMAGAVSLAGCAKNKDAAEPADASAALKAGQQQSAVGAEDAELRTDGGTGTMGEGEALAELVTVYFDFDKANVKESEIAKVKRVSTLLKRQGNEAFRIKAEGHADDRGSADYNMVLGTRRATAVRELLQSFGIAPDRIEIASYGEEFPVVSGDGETSYAQNRRVEWVLLSGK